MYNIGGICFLEKVVMCRKRRLCDVRGIYVLLKGGYVLRKKEYAVKGRYVP